MIRSLRGIAAAALILAVIGCILSPAAKTQVRYQFQILHGFGAGADGNGPDSPVIFDQKGNLYGVTYVGGANELGTAFELTPGTGGHWTETILHNFIGNKEDGYWPVGIVIDAHGNLYGLTKAGGTSTQCEGNGCGTVFELSPGAGGEWTESILYNFCSLPNCADGGLPGAAPTLGPGGVLYGAAGDTAFKLTPGSDGWTLTTLYTFCSLPNCADGQDPIGSLTLDARGTLYGETFEGGTSDGGTVFVLHPQTGGQWTEIVLHDFDVQDPDEGYEASGGVTLHNHELYATTEGGGGQGCLGAGCGTVFDLTRGSGKSIEEQVLHAFGANGAQGITPIRAVVFDKRGNLFGITDEGGSPSCGCGVVYGMKPQGNGQWVYQVLHTFVGTDGVTPNSTLTLDSAGNLYGTTAGGGPNGGGTAFELSPTAQASK